MRFSILHLSDLHRDLKDEVQNNWLIDSIERDLVSLGQGRWKTPMPSICLVSGDLVYGVQAGAKDAEGEITRQNEQAFEFLVLLSDRFFKGDRARVVILPGNHDVFYQRVKDSSAAIPHPGSAQEKNDLVKEYFSDNSALRWSWIEMAFHRIVDRSIYDSRMEHFCNLYTRFYEGNRSYPLKPDHQFDIFDFPDLKLTMAALSSCYNNDPWQRAGKINPTALTAVCRQLRSPSRAGWLMAAAWHHNLTGGPAQDDYLDPEFLQSLIDLGVSIGFHGHQHRSAWFDERYRLGPVARKMTIISAATLCAGPTNLSPGDPRGYNVVELDNDTWSGHLHQRRMVNRVFNMPVWGPGQFVETSESFVPFELTPPVEKRPEGLDAQLALEAADSHLGHGEWRQALEVLGGHEHHPLARSFRLRALQELNDPKLTIETLTDLQDNADAVVLGQAILELGDKSPIEAYLKNDYIVGNSDASVSNVIDRMRMRLSR